MADSLFVTWNERDMRALTFAQQDAAALTWNAWESASSVPGPVIAGADGDLGRRCEGFAVEYAVAEDSGAAFEVAVLLDGEELERRAGLAGHITGTASVPDAAVRGMAHPSRHALTIAARNAYGGASARSYTFTAIEDLRGSCAYYLLRDGVPIARSGAVAPLFDYAAAGAHRYRVRAVDRFGGFADSNEVEVTSAVDCTILAPLEEPSRMTRLCYRVDAPPAHAGRFEAGGTPYFFEGRRFAVLEDGGGQRGQWRATFSAQSREEYENVLALARSGRPVIYRDAFGNGAVVSLDALPAAFDATATEFTLEMTQLEETGAIDYD